MMGISLVVILRDRETHKHMAYSVCEFSNDIYDAMLNAMIKHSDTEYECIRVDFQSIDIFDI